MEPTESTGNTPRLELVEPSIKLVAEKVRAFDDKARTVTHPITVLVVDRYGEVVVPRGGRFADFRKSPSIFFNHASWSSTVPAIGRNLDLTVTDVEVLALTQFAGLEQLHPLAETIYRLYRDDFMRAWSIGFRPVTESRDKVLEGQTGVTILEWELLEYSAVGIPANPEAVVAMCKAFGLPAGATDADLLKAVGAVELQKWWEVATPIFGRAAAPRLMQREFVAAPPRPRRTFMGFEEHGFTAPAEGATAPMHVHDYALYLSREGETAVFEGGCAYAVADHSHRITTASVMRGETEEADGHRHKLMTAAEVREALTPEPEPVAEAGLDAERLSALVEAALAGS